MMFGFGVWVLYFIDTALLLVIHIPYTQKWARGFTEPSRYFAFANGYNCGIYRREKYLYVIFSVLYFIGTALLVITHIQKTQKWASGSDLTLLFGKHTERRYVYKLERVSG